MLNQGLMEEGLKLHIFSSMVAGFVAALATSPVDVIKTRVMNQKIKGRLNKKIKGLIMTMLCVFKI